MILPTDRHMHFWDQAVVGDTLIPLQTGIGGKRPTFGLSNELLSKPALEPILLLGFLLYEMTPIGTLWAWISLPPVL